MHIASAAGRAPLHTRPLAELPALLTPGEAAEYLRITTRTLRAWEARGLISVTRPAGGQPRIQRDEIARLVAEGIR